MATGESGAAPRRRTRPRLTAPRRASGSVSSPARTPSGRFDASSRTPVPLASTGWRRRSFGPGFRSTGRGSVASSRRAATVRSPVRRVTIPKPSGGERLLGVHTPRPFADLDEWLRRRLRQVRWKEWKRYRTRRRNLHTLGIPERQAREWAGSHKGYWRIAGSHRALRRQRYPASAVSVRGYIESHRGSWRDTKCLRLPSLEFWSLPASCRGNWPERRGRRLS